MVGSTTCHYSNKNKTRRDTKTEACGRDPPCNRRKQKGFKQSPRHVSSPAPQMDKKQKQQSATSIPGLGHVLMCHDTGAPWAS